MLPDHDQSPEAKKQSLTPLFRKLVTSEPILEKLRSILVEKLDVTRKDATDAVGLLRSRMEVVVPTALEERLSRDPDDDRILATALAARADCIVTGDRDLLDLRTHEGIRIVTPSDFWKIED